MFWILKIFPHWFWSVTLATGFISFFAGYLAPLKTYALPFKIIGTITIAATIFIFGMMHADSKWQQHADTLQAKADLLAQQSQQANQALEAALLAKSKTIKIRGATITEYVDREVVKYDNLCVIPEVFVLAHNKAAESSK